MIRTSFCMRTQMGARPLEWEGGEQGESPLGEEFLKNPYIFDTPFLNEVNLS